MTIHSAIKSNALVYQRVEQLLRESTQPLARAEIYERAAIREVTAKEHTIGDVLKALYSKGKIRRVPYSGKGKSQYAYEWVHSNITGPTPAVPVEELVSKVAVTENKLPTGRKFQADKPEITVTANGVTIVTSKIRITVEL